MTYLFIIYLLIPNAINKTKNNMTSNQNEIHVQYGQYPKILCTLRHTKSFNSDSNKSSTQHVK